MTTPTLEPRAAAQTFPVTHHRTTKVDGVNIFYREAVGRMHRSFCSCTDFLRHHTCSAT